MGVQQNNLTLNGLKWCVAQKLENSWTLGSGIVINQTNSTEDPTINPSATFSATPKTYTTGSLIVVGSPIDPVTPMTANVSCQSPSCLHTSLRAHPVYQRGDMSEYLDTSDTVQTMHICGNGSNLDGTDL